MDFQVRPPRGEACRCWWKTSFVDFVVERIREQMPEDQAPQVQEFALGYYEWVDAAELEGPTFPIGAAKDASLTNCLPAGGIGEWKIRVFSPHFSRHGYSGRPTL